MQYLTRLSAWPSSRAWLLKRVKSVTRLPSLVSGGHVLERVAFFTRLAIQAREEGHALAHF